MAAKNNLNEMCMLCGEKKRRGRSDHLIGPECYKRWLETSGKHLGETGKDLPLLPWVLEEADKLQKSGQLQKEFIQAQTDCQNLNEEVRKEAFEQIKTALREYVPKEKFDAAMKARKELLWATKGGNRLYAQMKALEHRIGNLPDFIKNLQEELKTYSEENPGNPADESKEKSDPLPEEKHQNSDDQAEK